VRVFEASAPGRCGIIGNPSDIYGGSVVSCSIPLRARCRLTLGADQELPEDQTLWDAVAARFPIDGPVRVEWSTDIPRSSGLAGSTALLGATLACVLAVRGEGGKLEDKTAFAELVRDIERNEAGIMCGYQDAYMVTYGGLQHMDFAGKHPVDAGPPATITSFDADLPFLLITTGVERLSGAVHAPMVDRWLDGDPLIVNSMHTLSGVARVARSWLISKLYFPLAKIMIKSHELVASIGGSGPEVEQLIAECFEGGALAAKLAGAGHGGTVIALTLNADELQPWLESRGYSIFTRPVIAPGVMLERSDE
jgi:galactokinase/mevalonate kinase-like predicted kinase